MEDKIRSFLTKNYAMMVWYFKWINFIRI